MREFINLMEEMSSFFNPNGLYLHGGPSVLQDNRFHRNSRNGKDAGGLFFAKDDQQGLQHALGYAIKAKNGGVWYCKLHIKPEQVFDYSDEDCMNKLRAVTSEEDYDYIIDKAKNWSIVWLTLPSGKKPEEYLIEAGFRAAIVKAKSTSETPNTFLCVFIPSDIEIINFIPKDQLIPKPVHSI